MEFRPENIPLNIIYEDNKMLVIDKPAGMVVHPAAGNYEGTLINALLYYLGETPHSNFEPGRLGLVHRSIRIHLACLLLLKMTDRWLIFKGN